MDDLCCYADRPVGFLLRYVHRRFLSHLVILVTVLAAVGCSVGTQYGIKLLVDALDAGPAQIAGVWQAFLLLVALVAGDNLLWRIAGWIAAHTFVGVTGDLRAELFRHLTGHPPGYFAERQPGTLTGRVTATSNAAFAIETMFVWNVLPPCAATVAAIAFLSTVSVSMTLVLTGIAIVLVPVLFRLAAAGKPLHHRFANRAAAVDGEMVDVVGNMLLVRTFGGLNREQRRFEETVGRELTARQSSLRYLEKLRMIHATVTVTLAVAVLAWGVVLWQRGAASTGDVVLLCSLGFAILYATRDLAVALVDVTQHMARLAEAVHTLLVPHELADAPGAAALARRRGTVAVEAIRFAYPGGRQVFDDFSLRVPAGQRIGLVGPSGGGKSTLLALLQRLQPAEQGRILVDGQDIAGITSESLHAAIALVPQDVTLLHRSIGENIRYGRPEATDSEVLAAAEAARCADFIAHLPQGMATVVGDRGVKLSGGQRQRIAIARALLKDAPILLLDEATSALDSESEEAIREALDHAMRGRTVIAIAHRLSTLRGFDRIVLLDHGRIVQDGPPDLLMRADGPYRQLIQREMTRLARKAA
jgi:ATP-binding cassette, subfamily B, bacterial